MIVDADSSLFRLFFYDGSIIHAQGRLALLSAYPAGVLALVVPRVDVLAGADSVADEVGIAVVADLLVADDPAGPWVRVSNGFLVHWLHPRAHGYGSTV